MEQTTLTIRLPSDLVQGAERYAEQHQTSLTQLIALYLRQLVAQEHLLDNAPIVRRLSGILPARASIDERVPDPPGTKAQRFDSDLIGGR